MTKRLEQFSINHIDLALEYAREFGVDHLSDWILRDPKLYHRIRTGGLPLDMIYIRKNQDGEAQLGNNTKLSLPSTEKLRKEVAFWNAVLSECLPWGLPHPSDGDITYTLKQICSYLHMKPPDDLRIVDTPHALTSDYLATDVFNNLSKKLRTLVGPLKGKGLTTANRIQSVLEASIVGDQNLIWRMNVCNSLYYIHYVQSLTLLPFVNSKYEEDYTKIKKLFRTIFAWARHEYTENDAGVRHYEKVPHDIVIRWPLAARRDERSRLHCATGPAVVWRDNSKMFFLHGIECTEEEVLHTQPEKILFEDNVQKRSVLIEHVGAERFLKACSAKELHQDSIGQTLWSVKMPDLRDGFGARRSWREMRMNDIRIVEVINSTPEPDDDGVMVNKHYYLFVPPQVRKVEEAIAWTFNLTPDEYAPLKQT